MVTTRSSQILRGARTAFLSLGAYVLGMATVPVLYYLTNRTTEVWVANRPVTAEGIVIPAGTKLVHDRSMSEGFDTLRLYINVAAPEDRLFTRSTEPHSFLVIPYWLRTQEAQATSRQFTAVPNPGMQRTRYARR